ncbi:hypothetical protein VTK73DRAFT_2081 [Phialemonium thermophilum]|uniref:LysM domain-containing protein n=1 Tax=Phialemonium thermophilum TaxID=223376 RepID=A0ABR3X6M3_9PEZI
MQLGMASNCYKFYTTKTGDSCANIASTYKVALADFYACNTGVGSNCETLLADAYYCVGTFPSPGATCSVLSLSQCDRPDKPSNHDNDHYHDHDDR